MSEYKYLVGCDEQGNVTPNAQVPTRAKYVEPQSASGTLALDASRETFYDTITATGPLAITFAGTRLGSGILLTLAGTQSITVAGVPVVAGQVVALAGENWRVIQAGIVQSGATTSTLTVGSLSVSVSTTAADLSVTGALDTGSGLAAQPYRFSKDGGATWTAWQSSPSYRYEGLTPSTSSTTSTYQFRHQVRNVAGEQRSGAIVTKNMGVVVSWTELTRATFTAADGTAVAGLIASNGETMTADTNVKVKGNRATGDGALAIPTGNYLKMKVTGDYDVTAMVGDPSGSAGVHMRVGGWATGINVQKDGSITTASYPFATFNWNVIRPTGNPLTGTVTITMDAPAGTGEVYIGTDLVATFSSADFYSASDSGRRLNGAAGRINAYAGVQNKGFIDNLTVSVA